MTSPWKRYADPGCVKRSPVTANRWRLRVRQRRLASRRRSTAMMFFICGGDTITHTHTHAVHFAAVLCPVISRSVHNAVHIYKHVYCTRVSNDNDNPRRGYDFAATLTQTRKILVLNSLPGRACVAGKPLRFGFSQL